MQKLSGNGIAFIEIDGELIEYELAAGEQLLVDSGLGTCWGGYLCRIVNLCDDLKSALHLPEGHRVYGVLMAGMPDERYLHVPYRPAADIEWVE